MPQSLSYLLTHIVFSTKDRAPVLDLSIRPALHQASFTDELKRLLEKNGVKYDPQYLL